MSYIRLANVPALVGIRLRPTMILGKKVHGYVKKGITVDRLPAKDCTASIHEKESGQFISLLWWLSPNESGHVIRSVTIESGGYADLMIFARLRTEPLRYFIYNSSNGEASQILAPPDEIKFRETKQFFVRVCYGGQKFEFDVTLRKGLAGELNFEHEQGSAWF
jgi:hypothetical protein